MRKISFVAVLAALAAVTALAQGSASPAGEWQKSANGFVWTGTRYWESVVNGSADEREVIQGGYNQVFQKNSFRLIGKVWFSISPEKDARGQYWTGNAQEFDLGLEIQKGLPRGWQIRAGYSHNFLTESAGSDVEMILLAVSKEVVLTEKNKLVGAFEFYQFLPTSKKGPAGGKFYVSSVTFSRTAGKWNTNMGIATVFNSKGAFGLVSEQALRITGQVLYKLPKMAIGPDFTYGGVPHSSQRQPKTTFGFGFYF